MTGVRSFDIKAYDNSLAGYADLGWGDDPRVTGLLHPPNRASLATTHHPRTWRGTYDPCRTGYVAPAYAYINGGTVSTCSTRPSPTRGGCRPWSTTTASTPSSGRRVRTCRPIAPTAGQRRHYTGNIGDDNPAGRPLAAGLGFLVHRVHPGPGHGGEPRQLARRVFPAGPPYAPPIYPSYPPPYPAPLRGIQIQIRVTDPTNQRVKTLTIRQDFTDKL